MRLCSLLVLARALCSLESDDQPERPLKVQAAADPFQAVIETARNLVGSAEYVNLLLKLKGINNDGSFMDKGRYLSYMSSILRVTKRPEDWQPDLLELLFASVHECKNAYVDASRSVGYANLYEWMRFKEVLANAVVFAEEVALVNSERYKEYAPKLEDESTIEGSHYSRLAYYTDFFSHLFAMHDDSRSFNYADDVHEKGRALEKTWYSEMVALSQGSYFKDVILANTTSPSYTSSSSLVRFLQSLWAARDIVPIKFERVPVAWMARVIHKLKGLINKYTEPKHQRGIGFDLLRSDFEDLIDDIKSMLPYFAGSDEFISPNVIAVEPIGYRKMARSPKSVADLVSPRNP